MQRRSFQFKCNFKNWVLIIIFIANKFDKEKQRDIDTCDNGFYWLFLQICSPSSEWYLSCSVAIVIINCQILANYIIVLLLVLFISHNLLMGDLSFLAKFIYIIDSKRFLFVCSSILFGGNFVLLWILWCSWIYDHHPLHDLI